MPPAPPQPGLRLRTWIDAHTREFVVAISGRESEERTSRFSDATGLLDYLQTLRPDRGFDVWELAGPPSPASFVVRLRPTASPGS